MNCRIYRHTNRSSAVSTTSCVLQYIHYARTENRIQDGPPDSASPGTSTAPLHLREGVGGARDDERGEVLPTMLHHQTGELSDYSVTCRTTVAGHVYTLRTSFVSKFRYAIDWLRSLYNIWLCTNVVFVHACRRP